MTSKRILVLGITGDEKGNALNNLKKYQVEQYGEAKFKTIKFEHILCKEIRPKPRPIQEYLDETPNEQKRLWYAAWRQVIEKIEGPDYADTDVLLMMHGVLTRRNQGVRTPLILHRLIDEFRPTTIITLIDDVYLLWYRTWKRAGIKEYLGKPTLDELLEARRAEIFLGELLAKQTGEGEDPILHYVVSTWHPARVLDKILFGKPDLILTYMCFPISRPRKLLTEFGDDSLIKEMNDIFKEAIEYEAANPSMTFFCPLTIDELPLLDMTVETSGPDPYDDGKSISFGVFRLSDRWNVREFYGDAKLLVDGAGVPDEVKIPKAQIDRAQGFVRVDVATRDYRLVAQSDRLAVFNPALRNPETIATGVYNEIMAACSQGKPVHVYQNPEHDQKGAFERAFGTKSPSMGGRLTDFDLIVKHESVRELLKAVST